MRADDSLDHSASPPPQAKDTNIHTVRSKAAAEVEKTNRRDIVDPEVIQLRAKRALHVRQVKDMENKVRMVNTRIDKLNDGVEKIRSQWSEIEREKDALQLTNQRYKQELAAGLKTILKDDRTAKRYDDYIELRSEVLVLDDSDDDEDEDSPMYDWGAHGHGGGEGEDEHVQ